MGRSLLCLASLLLACSGAKGPTADTACCDLAYVPPPPSGTSVLPPLGARSNQPTAILQAFDWPFADVERELCALRADGFTHVHVSPPQLSNGGPWWGRYQPLDLRVIDGPLGDEAAFRRMAKEAQRCDMHIVVDAVLNHAANLGRPPAELYYPPGCNAELDAGSEPSACLWTPVHFQNPECIQNYADHCAVIYGRICGGGTDRGLPDLNTGRCEANGRLDINARNYDPHVLAVARQYLEKLVELGATGVRLDAAKHMHPAFIEDVLRSPSLEGRLWVYAEIIADRTFDPSFEAYRHIKGLSFMDFPLTRSMMESFGPSGSLRKLRSASTTGRGLNSEVSVAFVTNHDVWGNDSGLGYRYGVFQDEALSLLYLLGREEGVPYLYSELEGRSQSRRFRTPTDDYVLFHQRPFVRQLVKFHHDQLGKSQRWAWEDDQHLAFARGSDALVAINKTNSPWKLDGIDLLLEDGLYQDLFSGQQFTLEGGRTSGEVPGRWGRVLVKVSGRFEISQP